MLVGQSAIVQRFCVSRPHKLHRIINYQWVSENDGGALGFFCEIPFVCAETPCFESAKWSRAAARKRLRRVIAGSEGFPAALINVAEARAIPWSASRRLVALFSTPLREKTTWGNFMIREVRYRKLMRPTKSDAFRVRLFCGEALRAALGLR